MWNTIKSWFSPRPPSEATKIPVFDDGSWCLGRDTTFDIRDQRDVELGPDDMIGAALIRPAFVSDTTAWRLNIQRNGTLTQEILRHLPACNPDRHAVLRRDLEPDEIDRVLQLVNDTRFAELNDNYSCDCTDQEYVSIKVRIGDSIKAVYADGPFIAA